MGLKDFLQDYAPLFTISGSLISSITAALIAFGLVTRKERQADKTQILSFYTYLSAYAEYIFGQYLLYNNLLIHCRHIAHLDSKEKCARLDCYKQSKINPHYSDYIFALKASFEQTGSENILKLSTLCNAPEDMIFNYQFLNATLNTMLAQMHEFYTLDIDDISLLEEYTNKKEPVWDKKIYKSDIDEIRSMEEQAKYEFNKGNMLYAENFKAERNDKIFTIITDTVKALRSNSLIILTHTYNLEKDIKKSGYIKANILNILRQKFPNGASALTWENFIKEFEKQQDTVRRVREENFQPEVLSCL